MALPGDIGDATLDTHLHVPLGAPAAVHPTNTPHQESVASLAQASEAARTAIDICEADGYKESVAVTDASANLKAALAADGAGPNRAYMALRKDVTVRPFTCRQ